ncbi:MAG: MarC family protein [Phycisphaerales bacterium]|nr:MarC family protein [Phycisphaerales bacterium]
MNFWRVFFEALLPLFVAIDPIGLLPIFIGVTGGIPPARRRHIIFQAVTVATLVSFGFVFMGNWLFGVLSIDQFDFMIAGGVILLVLAVLDLLMPGKPTINEVESVGVVPLAMPLIAGPATLTTALVLASDPNKGYAITVLALAVNFAILLGVLLSASWISRLLGITTLRAVSKLVMVLLAAIAVNFIRSGIVGVLTLMRH